MRFSTRPNSPHPNGLLSSNRNQVIRLLDTHVFQASETDRNRCVELRLCHDPRPNFALPSRSGDWIMFH